MQFGQSLKAYFSEKKNFALFESYLKLLIDAKFYFGGSYNVTFDMKEEIVHEDIKKWPIRPELVSVSVA